MWLSTGRFPLFGTETTNQHDPSLMSSAASNCPLPLVLHTLLKKSSADNMSRRYRNCPITYSTPGVIDFVHAEKSWKLNQTYFPIKPVCSYAGLLYWSNGLHNPEMCVQGTCVCVCVNQKATVCCVIGWIRCLVSWESWSHVGSLNTTTAPGQMVRDVPQHRGQISSSCCLWRAKQKLHKQHETRVTTPSLASTTSLTESNTWKTQTLDILHLYLHFIQQVLQ